MQFKSRARWRTVDGFPGSPATQPLLLERLQGVITSLHRALHVPPATTCTLLHPAIPPLESPFVALIRSSAMQQVAGPRSGPQACLRKPPTPRHVRPGRVAVAARAADGRSEQLVHQADRRSLLLGAAALGAALLPGAGPAGAAEAEQAATDSIYELSAVQYG